MKFIFVRAVCSSLLRRGMLLGKTLRYLQAESKSIQAGGLGMKALLESRCKYIGARHWVDVHLECSQMSPLQRLICPGKQAVRFLSRSALLVCLIVLSVCNAGNGFAQFGLPGLGGKSGKSNDQKANQLLHQHLPLVLDANTAYPTVPDQDMLGGPFRPRTLPVTVGSLTKPLPPGDYVLPIGVPELLYRWVFSVNYSFRLATTISP